VRFKTKVEGFYLKYGPVTLRDTFGVHNRV
jgi:hypothetical protein